MRFRDPLAPLLLVLLAACDGFVGGSPRPGTDGYTADLLRRLGKSGARSEAKIAFRNGCERRDEGNRSILVLPDRKKVYEREGAAPWQARPLSPGDSAESLEGPYPLRPIRFSEAEVARLETAFPGEKVILRKLSDEAVGVHPCDVLRIERTRPDGSGVSETRYYARDLDGLVVRRELRKIVDREYGEAIGTEELRDVRAGVPPETFEPR